MMRRTSILLALLAFGGLVACEEVPDIRFVPDDGGSTGTVPEGGSSVKDAGGAETGPVSACPGTPPAGGVCCGNNGCIGDRCVDALACNDCAALTCASGELCCARGGGPVQCKPRCQ